MAQEMRADGKGLGQSAAGIGITCRMNGNPRAAASGAGPDNMVAITFRLHRGNTSVKGVRHLRPQRNKRPRLRDFGHQTRKLFGCGC